MGATTTLERRAVAGLRWRDFEGAAGVRYKTVWRDPHGTSYAGLITMGPGASLPPHTHRRAVHHVWIADGSCTVLDRALESGSYSYVPAGTEHGVEAGPDGVTLFYLYLHPDVD